MCSVVECCARTLPWSVAGGGRARAAVQVAGRRRCSTVVVCALRVCQVWECARVAESVSEFEHGAVEREA